MNRTHRAFLFFLLTQSTTYLHPQETAPKKPSQDPFEQTAYTWSLTFAEAMQKANNHHYNLHNAQDAFVKATNEFLNNLDPHSGFLDPKTYQAMLQSTQGEFYGIGIVIDATRKTKDKQLTIIETIPGGPSDKAGIQWFDKIVEIDGKPLEGMTTEEATNKLKGPRNSTVEVKILREGYQDLLSFKITRDVVKEQHSLCFYIKDQNICYLSLTMFSHSAIKQMEDLLEQAHKKKYKGLILDLRYNSGGLLDAAVDIAGLFLKINSPVVVIKDKNNVPQQEYRTAREPVSSANFPIFILINNYTASAGEILAGVLKIHAKNPKLTNNPYIFLVGTPTFGKGSVQTIFPVSNNSAVKITTGLYYLPNGKTIQGTGIKPDFFIERTMPPTEQMQWFTKYYGRESNLGNYIKPDNLEKTEDTPKSIPDQQKEGTRLIQRAEEMVKHDNQLRQTITLINMLDTAHQLTPRQVNTRDGARTHLKKQYITDNELVIEEIKGNQAPN